MKLGTKNKPIKLTKKNILKYLTACIRLLNEQNVPKKDRWIRIPDSWYKKIIALEKKRKRISKSLKFLV